MPETLIETETNEWIETQAARLSLTTPDSAAVDLAVASFDSLCEARKKRLADWEIQREDRKRGARKKRPDAGRFVAQFNPDAVCSLGDGSFEVRPGYSAAEAFPAPVIDLVTGEPVPPLLPQPSILPERDYGELGERGHVAECLEVEGLAAKARAYANCFRCGRKFYCPNDGKKFFGRFRCRMRFCPQCAHANATRLLADITWKLDHFFETHDVPLGYVFLRINFTWRASDRPFSPEDVRKFNRCVKRTLKRALGLSVNRRMEFGYLLIDETGFEYRGRKADRKASGWNLHCHGLYFGPHYPWWEVKKVWAEETQRAFGVPSYGCPFSPVRDWRRDLRRSVLRALRHHTKYIDKIPGVSAERIAGLEKAFWHTRRFRMGGLWHGLPARPKRKGDPPCPDCEKRAVENPPQLVPEDGRVVRSRKTGKERTVATWWPVEQLRDAGYVELVPDDAGDSSP